MISGATKLVIFDFDGTLADTRDKIVMMLQRVMRKRGLPVASDERCASSIGIPLKGAFQHILPGLSDAEAQACTDTYRDLFNRYHNQLVPDLFPHVRETLDELCTNGIRMSIASSRTSRTLWKFLSEMGIQHYFECVIGAEDCPEHKPSPVPVLLTLEQLGEEAANTVVVGDMPADILMGLRAGCRSIGVSYGNSTPDDLAAAGASHIINDFAQLLPLCLPEKK